MVPLFPVNYQNSSQPITVQKMISDETSHQHRFKHLPEAQLRAVTERARADHRLEETTRSLLQSLRLQPGSGGAAAAAETTHHHCGGHPQSDSEVLSEVSHQLHNEHDAIRPIPTATTLLSEQGRQAGGGGGGTVSCLPSLQVLRTLQQRLVDALQHVSDLRSQGPWQERVLDQPDWNRKLMRMDEFHANVTRQMYVLSRQVDLIMDTVCGVPGSRITATVKADVVRKLVRAHRSALRIIQAYGQNYWEGSLDGRQAGRFLEVLSVCRNLVQVCSHIGVQLPQMADLPERLAAMVEQHVTRSGDVTSLIREMALGRFGGFVAGDAPARPSVTLHGEGAPRHVRGRPAGARSSASNRHSATSKRRHHLTAAASARNRCMLAVMERASVRSAPVARRRLQRSVRPGSAPQSAPLAGPASARRPAATARRVAADRPTAEQAPLLTPLTEEDASIGRSQSQLQSNRTSKIVTRPSGATARLVVAVEEAVDRALARASAAAAGATVRDSLGADLTGSGRQAQETLQRTRNDGNQAAAANKRSGGCRKSPAVAAAVDSCARHQQLRRTARRLDQLQREREQIRRRWQPLIDARRRREEDAAFMTADVPWPLAEFSLDSDNPLQCDRRITTDAHTSTTSLAGPQCTTTAGDRGHLGVEPKSVKQASFHLNPPGKSADEVESQQRWRQTQQGASDGADGAPRLQPFRDMFAEEVIDPTLRENMAAELHAAVRNVDDSDINRLPESTLHDLVNNYISEAGIDIFLQQLFQREFQLN